MGFQTSATCPTIARLHRLCTGKVQTAKVEERGRNEYSIERRENSLSHNSMLHRNRDAHTTPDGPATVGACVWSAFECTRRGWLGWNGPDF